MQFIDLSIQQTRIKANLDQRIQDVLAHGKYILGPEVFELEAKLAQYVGVGHCVSCSSGTDALSMSMIALGIKSGDEVITSPFTWISTVEAIVRLGAKAVFVDIDKDTYNVDASLIEAAITEKTKAIIPVSLYGQCSDMTAINAIAKKYNLAVIEDGAQSFGATHHGKRSGGLAIIGCTSFFPAKPLGCYGDGGACFTDNDELAEKMRWVRVHGQRKRHDVQMVGINGRFDTLQAAILLEKFAIFPDEVERRQRVAESYNQRLSGVVKTPDVLPENTSVYAQYTIACDDRDRIQAQLKEAGIPCGVYYPVPAHFQPAYQNLGYNSGDFPVAESIVSKILSLPMHPYLEEEQIDQICDVVKGSCLVKM